MCSVVGYIGKEYCRNFILEGLTRLEYRGYDSAGFACLEPHSSRLRYCRASGTLQNLTDKIIHVPIDGHIGIGHTRWSTHGKPTETNAHPQFDCNKAISIVHNGIIENHNYLKRQLLADGHQFYSDTDTEIIAHLLESLLIKHNLKTAVQALASQLEGAYAFICIMEQFPDCMLVVRKRSPLCLGIGEHEVFVASDVIAFADKTKQVVFLPDESFAIIKQDFIELYDFKGAVLPMLVHELDTDWYQSKKDGHEHFMLKEIYEQKEAIRATIAYASTLGDRLYNQIGLCADQMQGLERLSLVACGTSWHAARIAQFFFETICYVPTKVYLASEMRYMPFFKEEYSLHVALSQSGETADTLEVLRMFKQLNVHTLAVTNVASSSLAREADGFLLTQAGPEVAVASTKAFSTQLALLYWFAHYIAYEKKIINMQALTAVQEDLYAVAQLLEQSIDRYAVDIKQRLAPYYCQFTKSIFLGRNISYPFAMEAALKLKEISYIFAQCYPAGELKHGPLALIDEDVPVFIFSCQDPLIYNKLVVNVQEAKARGGHIVAFCFQGQQELIDMADTSFVFAPVKPLLEPLVMTGVMQYFVYEIAKVLGCEIDKPRNLAKSVTVE